MTRDPTPAEMGRVIPRMHEDEVAVDAALARALIGRDRPDLLPLPILPVPAWGTDHVIYRLGDRLAARFPKIAWADGQAAKEARWLPVFAPHLPAEVPTPVLLGAPGFGYPYSWSIAPWIEGDPVHPELTDLSALAEDLAGFIVAMEAMDPSGAPLPGPGDRGGALHDADASTRAAAERLRGDADVDELLSIWAAGVDAAPWAAPPRWVHGDLMDGNLLLRDGRLAAVLDWGGLKAGDPAVELMVCWSLFDAPARELFRSRLGFVDDAMWLRGRAWATSAALQALPYYRDTNPDIVARSWRTVRAVLERPASTDTTSSRR